MRLPQVVVTRGLGQCASGRFVRMKRQRDERDEAVGFVLRIAELQQMVDALLGVSTWP